MTKKTPKGRVPSLIGGANGRPVRMDVQRRSECYRCEDELLAGTLCIAIPRLGGGFTSKRRVCDACYQAILKQTSDDLEELRQL
jgi:hypothetical protein